MTLGDTTTTTAILQPARRAVWRYVGGLMPVIVLWAALAGWLAWQLYDRSRWPEAADQATMKEWLEESRTFRKSLAELAREQAGLKRAGLFSDDHRSELAQQLKSLAEPTRMFANQLPSFPEVYTISVTFADETVEWRSPVPKPPTGAGAGIRTLAYPPDENDPATVIRVEYHLHALNRLQQQEADRRQTAYVAGALLVTATVLAGLFVHRFWRREHAREIDRLEALAAAEHHQLEHSLAERRLENQEHEHRTQLYAGIGVLAGSYAHNIKNLLVRPNDLLARCVEAGGVSAAQTAMLDEVRATLGTVTQRLQQILQTVKRDPNTRRVSPMDVSQLVTDTAAAWAVTAAQKWKVTLRAEVEPGLTIEADESHLQQALENLIVNARDATFDERKTKLLAAAAWRGDVVLRAQSRGGRTIIAVQDNGIGMTPDVKAKCLQTHFTTKRDNALYEGYSAGMGLGLSFVAMVAEHHAAAITIDSTPGQGTTFELSFSNSQALTKQPLRPPTVRNEVLH
jgi:signal transduction histidine kinase